MMRAESVSQDTRANPCSARSSSTPTPARTTPSPCSWRSASPEDFDILGIVAVAGNVSLAQNARNALKIVELAGRTDVKVYAGCERPMRRHLVTAEHVHGETGLDGPDLPLPTKAAGGAARRRLHHRDADVARTRAR